MTQGYVIAKPAQRRRDSDGVAGWVLQRGSAIRTVADHQGDARFSVVNAVGAAQGGAQRQRCGTQCAAQQNTAGLQRSHGAYSRGGTPGASDAA